MSPQEFFDATVNAIRAQGVPSATLVVTFAADTTPGQSVMCLYRGPNNTKCGAGVHISDAEYDSRMEGKRVRSLTSDYGFLWPGHVLNLHPLLANALQDAHDRAAWQHLKFGEDFLPAFEVNVRHLALDVGLVYTPVEG